MKNKLFFCLLAMPAFINALGPVAAPVLEIPGGPVPSSFTRESIAKCAVSEPVRPHQFAKNKNEEYQLRVSFAEAYRRQLFAQLTNDKVVFPDINDRSKVHEITYQQANEILYKFAKKAAALLTREDYKRRLEEKEIIPMAKKMLFSQLTSREKYLLQVAAMHSFNYTGPQY
jgi:hypothetical protein